MTKTINFRYESASAKLTLWGDNTGTVSNLFSTRRGQGHAREVLKNICAYADENQMALILEARLYGYADGQSPEGRELKRVYARYGFKDIGNNIMERQPKEMHNEQA